MAFYRVVLITLISLYLQLWAQENTIPSSIDQNPSLQQHKGAGAGGIKVGITINDMSPVKQLLLRNDSLGDSTINYFDFNDQLNNYAVLPTYGFQGYYQFNNGIRLGGAIVSSFGSWYQDGFTGSNYINMLYWNTYYGALFGLSLGDSLNHFNVTTTIGGGAMYLGFITYDDENYYAQEILSTSMPYFVTDLQVSYLRTLGKHQIFHLGIDGGVVLQTTTGSNYQGFTLGDFTTLNPTVNLRFIWGRKG